MADSTTRTLSDVYQFDTENGTINAVDEAVVESYVKTDIKDAFNGEEVSTDTTTPIGRMIEWLALHFTNTLSINVQNANQLVLRAAAGQQLDAMAYWFQMERKSPMKTQVTATLEGTAGATIPQGSRAQTVAGDIFVSTADVELNASGTGTVTFEAEETGPISCPKNTLTIIDTPTIGWASITNTADGTLGRDIETDDDLRLRIENERTTASGWLQAIKNGIEKIEGVRSSMVLENNTGSALDVHGVPMAPHSIFICIDGITKDSTAETKQALAKAVLDSISSGTGYTRFENAVSSKYDNEIQATATDDYGNTYTVYAYAPESCAIEVATRVKNRSYTGKDMKADVKNAILSWSSEATLAIGEAIYSSDIIKAVEERVPGVIVVSATVNEVNHTDASSYVEVPGNQIALFSENHITVTPFV